LRLFFDEESHLRSAVSRIRALFGPQDYTELSIAGVVTEARQSIREAHGAKLEAVLDDQVGRSQWIQIPQLELLLAELVEHDVNELSDASN
jgi:hypothetical protein